MFLSFIFYSVVVLLLLFMFYSVVYFW
uniref:Uncharacterized protein n=1 Tax=Triatoma infestans TaxID=30076 RepID=A0A170XRB8_TRIIF